MKGENLHHNDSDILYDEHILEVDKILNSSEAIVRNNLCLQVLLMVENLIKSLKEWIYIERIIWSNSLGKSENIGWTGYIFRSDKVNIFSQMEL